VGRISIHNDGFSGPGDPWELAEVQYGRVAAWQIAEPRTQVDSWLRSCRLEPDRWGVYKVPGVPELREARWMSGVLACGPRGLLSHLSGGAHRGILVADGPEVDVTVPRSREGRQGIRVHRPRRMPVGDVHKGIPITTPTQILIDLATTFTQPNLERALGEAELLGLLDEEELARRGGPKLRRILNGHEAGSDIPKNVMEQRFRDIVRAAGLEQPEMHAELLGYEIDFLWRDRGVAVETDGRSVHARRAAFQRDRAKDRDLQLAGYLALRFTYAEIMSEPELVTAGCCRACASGPARAWSAASRVR